MNKIDTLRTSEDKEPNYRLNRLIASVALGATAMIGLAGPAQEALNTNKPTDTVRYDIQPGENLWEVASEQGSNGMAIDDTMVRIIQDKRNAGVFEDGPKNNLGPEDSGKSLEIPQ